MSLIYLKFNRQPGKIQLVPTLYKKLNRIDCGLQ